MFDSPAHKNQKRREEELGDLESPAFVRDPSTGIYLPDGIREEVTAKNLAENTHEDSPVDVKVRTDWKPMFVSGFIGIATLFVVGLYTYYAKHQWVEMKITADASKRAAEGADRAVQQSIEHFRVDERAWIEIELIKPILLTPRDDKFGAGFKYEIYPKNAGKTVARNIVVKAQGSSSTIEFGSRAYEMNSIQDKMLLDKFTESGTTKPVRIPSNPVPKVLAPSTTASVPFTIIGQEPQIFPKTQWVSYLIGRINYCDEFQVRHWLKFCFFVVNSRGELWNCQEGNDEDRNSETPRTPSCSAP